MSCSLSVLDVLIDGIYVFYYSYGLAAAAEMAQLQKKLEFVVLKV